MEAPRQTSRRGAVHVSWDDAWQDIRRELVQRLGDPDYRPSIQWFLIRVLAATDLDIMGLRGELALYEPQGGILLWRLLQGHVWQDMAVLLARKTGIPWRWWLQFER